MVLKSTSNDDTDMDVEAEQPREYALVDANTTLSTLQETPVKIGRLPYSSRKSKGRKKLKRTTMAIKRKLKSPYEVTLSTSDSDCETSNKDLKLYDGMFNQLKEKYQKSESHEERIQILTLSPFTIERTMNEFKASNYMVKKSRAALKEKGILALCDKNKGKNLDPEVIKHEVDFYQNDDNS